MRLIVDLSSILKTCLFAGKDPAARTVEFGDKTVSVNTSDHGYEGAIDVLVKAMNETGTTPKDLVLVDEGFNPKALRQRILAGYKSRPPSAQEIHEEFHKLKQQVCGVLARVGAIRVTQDCVEADDIIAWFAKHTKEDIVIVSNDGDMLALQGQNEHGAQVSIRGTAVSEGSAAKYTGIEPRNITVYKALVGDTSDRITGIPGFGDKAFNQLMSLVGNEGLAMLGQMAEKGSLKEIEAQGAEYPIIGRVVKGAAEFITCYRLAKLYPDAVNTLDNPLSWHPGMTLGSTEDERLRKWEAKARLVTADKWADFVAWAPKHIGDWLALDIETSTPDESDDWLAAQGSENGVDVIGSRLSGMSLTFGNNLQYTVYIPVDHVETSCVKSEDLRDFIASLNGVTKVIHNTQFEGTVLFNEWGQHWLDNGFHGFLPNWLDTKFEASYVDENEPLGLKKLSKHWLDYDQTEYDEVTTLEGEPGTMTGGRLLGEFKKCVKEAVTRVATEEDEAVALAIEWADAEKSEDIPAAEALFNNGPSVKVGDILEVSPAEFVMVERRQYKMRELPAQHVFKYACDDTVTTSALHNFFKLFMQLEGTWQVYLDTEIDASYLHTQSFVQGVPISVERLQELSKADDETYEAAEKSLFGYLIEKGWEGSQPPEYDGEPTPKQIKEAFTIVTGEELETSVRKLNRLAAAIEPRSPTMAGLIRERNWEGFKQLVDMHFDGKPKFNSGSPKQMQKLFYEVMQLPIRVYNKPTDAARLRGDTMGTPMTSELAIKYAMLDAGPAEAAALEAIRLLKLVQTRRGLYYGPYPYFVHWKTGLVHPSHNQCAANTRRATFSSPNVQQLAKHEKVKGQAARIREVIVPHKKGAVVVSMDFSSQEILLLAEWSHDPVLELAFTGNPPLDLHSKTGVGIWNQDFAEQLTYEEFKAINDDKSHDLHKQAKKYRALGKTVNFGSQYRMAAKKASQVMMITESEAQAALDAKAEAFPVSEEWATREMELVKETGVSKTLLGAVRHLGKALNSSDRIEAGKAERQTLSFRIQGSAAEMTKQAEGAMWRAGLVQKYDCRIYFPVHDEVVASVVIDQLHEFLPEMHQCMTRRYANMRLPIRSSVSFGPSFGEQFECDNIDGVTREQIDKALAKMREVSTAL